jgi:spore germination protein GerM
MDRLSHKNETENPGTSPAAPPAQPAISPAAENPASETPAVLPAEEPLADVPPEAPQAPLVTETKPVTPPAGASQGKSQDRALYFIRVDGDGDILRTPVTRAVAVSSPLADAMRLLIQGPTAEEKSRYPRLRSLIPPGTQFLRAEVRGSTAYINFSEEFKFNNDGVEGYMGQLWQIIWTATEFPNIADVQILIDGRIVEYLGERIKIGSPLNRNSFYN